MLGIILPPSHSTFVEFCFNSFFVLIPLKSMCTLHTWQKNKLIVLHVFLVFEKRYAGKGLCWNFLFLLFALSNFPLTLFCSRRLLEIAAFYLSVRLLISRSTQPAQLGLWCLLTIASHSEDFHSFWVGIQPKALASPWDPQHVYRTPV